MIEFSIKPSFQGFSLIYPNLCLCKYYLLQIGYSVLFLSYKCTLCCCCSVTKSFLTLCNPMDSTQQTSLAFTTSQSLPRLMSIELVVPSNHLILCSPLFLLPLIIPRIRVFSSGWLIASGGQRIGVSTSASVLPMNIQD